MPERTSRTDMDANRAFQERRNKRSCATTVAKEKMRWNIVVPIEKILKETQSALGETDVRVFLGMH